MNHEGLADTRPLEPQLLDLGRSQQDVGDLMRWGLAEGPDGFFDEPSVDSNASEEAAEAVLTINASVGQGSYASRIGDEHHVVGGLGGSLSGRDSSDLDATLDLGHGGLLSDAIAERQRSSSGLRGAPFLPSVPLAIGAQVRYVSPEEDTSHDPCAAKGYAQLVPASEPR